MPHISSLRYGHSRGRATCTQIAQTPARLRCRQTLDGSRRLLPETNLEIQKLFEDDDPKFDNLAPKPTRKETSIGWCWSIRLLTSLINLKQKAKKPGVSWASEFKPNE